MKKEDFIRFEERGNRAVGMTQDTFVDNPREEYDHLGIIYANSRSYNVDKHHIDELGDTGEEIRDNLEENYIYLKVYAYIHGGITINTSGFSDPWDSAFFGPIAVSKEVARKEYGELTDEVVERIKGVLQAEVEELDAYYTDDVYHIHLLEKVESDDDDDEPEWEEYDGQGGFFGRKYADEEFESQVSWLEDDYTNEIFQ